EKIFSPVAYGVCSNVSGILKDPVNLVYKVAGHGINAITGVYDQAVLLSTSQYSLDLGNGEFTLNQSPVGVISCDVKGKQIFGDITYKRGDFIYDLLITYGGITSLDFDQASLSQFNTDAGEESGFYITSPMSILDAISQLLQPVMGELVFSRLGVASIGVLKLATDDASTSLTLTADEIMPRSGQESDSGGVSDVLEIRQAEPLYWKVILNYYQNHTIQDENAIGSAFPVDPTTAYGRAYRAFLKTEWRTTEIRNEGATTGKNLYPTAGELGPMDSFFYYRNDAEHWARKWLDMFGQGRRIVSVTCKALPLRTTINATFQLNYRWFNGDRLRAIKYAESWGENSIELEGII
ncbi:MAG: hypothetical protein Q8R07_04900, partial [Candidatus Uhrbacteria bacterium]|nr:hypothetical protein [Candidatus Uhrbacteria bacterium]